MAISLLAALFVATELTPRPSNSSGTPIGTIWNRIGLTGTFGNVRDGEYAGFNEFYVKRAEVGFSLFTSDELFLTNDFDRENATKIQELAPDYHVRAEVTYQWGGFVYKSWYRQEYSFLVADPETDKEIDDPQLVRELQLATADWLEDGKLAWKEWQTPRWPSDMRTGETSWKKTYPLAHLWDAVWCVLLLFALISIGNWLRLEYRLFISRTNQGRVPD